MESRQAEIDFTKEQLANLRLRLDSIKVEENKDEKDPSQSDEKINTKENQDDVLKQRVIQLESQLKMAQSKVYRLDLSLSFVFPLFYYFYHSRQLTGTLSWILSASNRKKSIAFKVIARAPFRGFQLLLWSLVLSWEVLGLQLVTWHVCVSSNYYSFDRKVAQS